jgi:transposase InsO family protein
MDDLKPMDPAEACALFRSEIIGALTRRDLARGELRAALVALSAERYRPPGAAATRAFSVTTLERWYYAYRTGGLAALRPEPRSDRGRARELTDAQRDLLLDIRREHPAATTAVILRTLVADGRLAADAVSEATVRRLYTAHGLDRVPARDGAGAHTRLRWQADRPGALWHGDVCHAAPLIVGTQRVPVRIHGLLDDASRYVVALEAHRTEREVDLLGVLVRALRRHGPPDAVYFDNGATYRGDVLRLACARLGVTLLHARPYDPQARGKMERFWRTLREGCLDHLGAVATLADVNTRLAAFLTAHYHVRPHAGLLGRAPGTVWAEAARPPDALDETALRAALTARVRRRVRRDTTVSIAGQDWELDQGFLAGRLVVVARCLVEPTEPPWIEYEGKRFALHPVDPVANARRPRPPRRTQVEATLRGPIPFDPAGALVDPPGPPGEAADDPLASALLDTEVP